ncbi:MAG TPA: P83/100 family protein, partial [Turneriella sp.]|nr:P83/100 family protein [Turneriella sp.]
MFKKYLLMVVVSVLLPVALFSINVNEKEIKSQAGFQFINSRDTRGSDTVTAIKGIGRSLATTGSSGAYRVIHAISKEGEKFDADIIVISKNARVNHIKNIRRIIEGYLVEKYKYSQADAQSLALFITYYNGFYRTNLDYFKQNYKPVVIKNLTAQNVGLDKKYTGWPGASRIVIPLSEGKTPDAGKIGEKEVMEEVRKSEKTTKDRENITKLQEKEVAQKEEKIQKKKEEVVKRKEEVAKREEKIKEEKQKNETNPNAADKKKKEEEIAKKEEEVKKEKEEVKKQEEKVAKEEKKVEEKKTEIAQNKQNIQADKKTQTKAEERKNETPAQREARLDAKEKELKENRKEDNIFGGKLYYLRVRDYSSDGKYRNDFYLIDPKRRKVRVKSPYNGIVGKKFDVVD